MPRREVRVIVVGAGLAGLVAARYLERAGATVTVLEARDRIGGRVLTMREGFVAGQHGELGADLIEAEQSDVLALAKALKLPAVRILRRGWGFHRRSSRKRSEGSAPDRFEQLAALLEPQIAAFKSAGCRWDSAVAAELGRQSAAGWLRSVKAEASLLAAVKGLRGFYLADPEDLSLLQLVDQFAEGETPGASAMYRLRDGNDTLPAAVAKELKGRIRLRAPVTSVTRRGSRLTVTVGGAAQASLRADYVVMTVPATIARKIGFEPALHDDQARAIRTLRYGPATKVLLQFDRRFWKSLTGPSAYGSDGPTGAVWDANEQQSRSPGILTLLAGGGASPEIREIMRGGWPSLVRRLSWLGRPARLLAAASHGWESDPWSKGGYAVIAKGFDPALRAWLARPAGRIVFAGEHTSLKWQGFMNGAVESGRRAAVEVAMLARLPYERLTETP